MSQANRLYALSAVDAAGTQITGIQDYDHDPGIDLLVGRGDGRPDPSFIAVMGQAPVLAFSTTAIAAALTACGLNGLSYTGSGILGDVNFYFQPISRANVRQTGATARAIQSRAGLLCITQIQATDRGAATASLTCNCISPDGVIAPAYPLAEQTMPVVPILGNHYTVGPAKVGTLAIQGIKSTTIDFGLQMISPEEGTGDGEVYPTEVAVMTRSPSISIRSKDMTLLDRFGIDPARLTATGTVDLSINNATVYLRKILKGSTRVPDATAEHLAFEMAAGMLSLRSVGDSEEVPQELELTLTAASDGVNDILAFGDAAITLPS